MNIVGFEKYLEKYGKKPQVIQTLIQYVQAFEDFLVMEYQKKLDDADAYDLQEYVFALHDYDSEVVEASLNSLALYYKFTGNEMLFSVALDLHENELAHPYTKHS